MMNDRRSRRTRKTERSRQRQMIGAVSAGVVALSVVGASATSLGGIASDSVGADVATIASCDTDGVQLKPFTNSYDATLLRYQTMSVTVIGINAACNTKTLYLTIRNAAGTSLYSGSGVIAATSLVLTISAPGIDSNAVAGAAVVITG